MDETSLRLIPDSEAGYVVRRCQAAARASLGERRTCLTYMGAICSESSLQPYVPQVLLTNGRLFGKICPRKELARNVFLWTEGSAWVTASVMRRWLSLLRRSLSPHIGERSIILLVDCAPAHLERSVEPFARRQRVRMLLVPPGLTRLLQPADTHLFSRLKQRIRRLYCAKQLSSATGRLVPLEWLEVIREAITSLLCSVRWRHAFERNGILSCQSEMSLQLCGQLFLESLPQVGSDPPALEKARRAFPRRCKLDIESYVTWRPRKIRTLD